MYRNTSDKSKIKKPLLGLSAIKASSIEIWKARVGGYQMAQKGKNCTIDTDYVTMNELFISPGRLLILLFILVIILILTRHHYLLRNDSFSMHGHDKEPESNQNDGRNTSHPLNTRAEKLLSDIDKCNQEADVREHTGVPHKLERHLSCFVKRADESDAEEPECERP